MTHTIVVLGGFVAVFAIPYLIFRYRDMKNQRDVANNDYVELEDELTSLQRDYRDLLGHANTLAQEKVLVNRALMALLERLASPPKMLDTKAEMVNPTEPTDGQRRIASDIKDTVEQLRSHLARPLDHGADPLVVAAARLETKDLVVDSSPDVSTVIITARDEQECEHAMTTHPHCVKCGRNM